MDFAPYQDTDPSRQRALSPPPKGSSNRPTSPPTRNTAHSPPPPPNPITSSLPPPNHFSDDRGFGGGGGGSFAGADLERGRLDLFETSLPLRLDWEACLAYLALPPAGGVLLLVVETRSDYVRFHAWQSSLLFSAIFVLHLIFSWSSILSWMLFVVDIGLIGFLTMHAYRDADGLDRYEVPFFGGLASSFVDAE